MWCIIQRLNSRIIYHCFSFVTTTPRRTFFRPLPLKHFCSQRAAAEISYMQNKAVSKRTVAFKNAPRGDFRVSHHLLKLQCTWLQRHRLNFKNKYQSSGVQARFIAWRLGEDLTANSLHTAGTHPQPLPGRRPSGCRRLFYPRWKCRRGRGRQGRTSGTGGPWRPPSGAPSSGRRAAAPGSAAPLGLACSQLLWSSGRPGSGHWGWPLAHEGPGDGNPKSDIWDIGLVEEKR